MQGLKVFKGMRGELAALAKHVHSHEKIVDDRVKSQEAHLKGHQPYLTHLEDRYE